MDEHWWFCLESVVYHNTHAINRIKSVNCAFTRLVSVESFWFDFVAAFRLYTNHELACANVSCVANCTYVFQHCVTFAFKPFHVSRVGSIRSSATCVPYTWCFCARVCAGSLWKLVARQAKLIRWPITTCPCTHMTYVSTVRVTPRTQQHTHQFVCNRVCSLHSPFFLSFFFLHAPD